MTDRPILVIIAGPNGSGKTTLTRQLIEDGVDFGFYINPDVIAEGLAGTYDQRVAAAQRIADQQRQDCLAERRSFAFETVMSHESKIATLAQARTAGYAIALYFVATETPELNVERVRQRVAEGGHDVPHDRIVARYARTMALLPQAIAQSDRAVLFDNSYREGLGARLEPFCEVLRIGDRHRWRVVGGKSVPQWASHLVERATTVFETKTGGNVVRISYPRDNAASFLFDGKFDSLQHVLQRKSIERFRSPGKGRPLVSIYSYTILARDTGEAVGEVRVRRLKAPIGGAQWDLLSVTMNGVELYRRDTPR